MAEMTDRYNWRGGSELLLRHGAGSPVTLLILPALFEEANRMRRFTVSVMRILAEAAIGSVLPDLPGTGESLTDLADVRPDDWRDAVQGVAETLPRPLLSIAIRGGALLDSIADHGWRLAPESGERIVRDLVRATAVSQSLPATEIDRQARAGPTRLAGSVIDPEFYAATILATLRGASRRTVRLADDAGPRDVTLSGSKLWRAAEPGDDYALASAAAADIISWAKTCAAS